MNNDRLNSLAIKFWEGDSTPEEEKELRQLLKHGPVPNRHLALASYLNTMSTIGVQELDIAFDNHILEKIDGRSDKKRIIPIQWLVAASIVLLLAFVFLFQSKTDETATADNMEFVDTYTDSEEAYKKVREALLFVSANMNEGMEQVEALGTFHEAQQRVQGDEIN